MPRLELQTAMISAFELCKKKAIPIQFAAKVPRLGTIGKNHIQSRFNLSEESVLFFCSESDTFLRNYITIMYRSKVITIMRFRNIIPQFL